MVVCRCSQQSQKQNWFSGCLWPVMCQNWLNMGLFSEYVILVLFSELNSFYGVLIWISHISILGSFILRNWRMYKYHPKHCTLQQCYFFSCSSYELDTVNSSLSRFTDQEFEHKGYWKLPQKVQKSVIWSWGSRIFIYHSSSLSHSLMLRSRVKYC